MRKTLAEIKKEMDKRFGFNALRPASELEETAFRIPTGSISLDIGLGGGIPAGRMTHIVGDYSAGKSALLYHILANAQKFKKKEVVWDRYSTKGNEVLKEVLANDGTALLAAIIQFESHAYANDWGVGCGLDIDNLLLSYPDGLEEGLDIATALQKEYGVDIIGIDSYAAANPTLINDTASDDTYRLGIKAVKFQDYHGRYQANNNRRDREGKFPCTLIALNQLRDKIGGYAPNGITPSIAPGGRSKDYTASVEILLKKGEHITVGSGANKVAIGQVVKWKVNKNKTYVPFRTGSYDFYFDEGGPVPAGNIDNGKEVAIEAVAFSVIQRSGAFYYYDGKKLAQGADNLYAFLREEKNEELREEIREKLMKVAFENIKENPPENTEE